MTNLQHEADPGRGLLALDDLFHALEIVFKVADALHALRLRVLLGPHQPLVRLVLQILWNQSSET